MTTLKQSRGIMRIDAEILEDGVRYAERDFLRSFRTTVPFEHISDELTHAFHVSRLYLVITIFFVAAFVLRLYHFVTSEGVSWGSLLWALFLALLAAGGTWMRSARYVGYSAAGADLLFFDKKGPQDPHEFLQAIQDAKSRYFHERYREAHSADSAASPEAPSREQLH